MMPDPVQWERRAEDEVKALDDQRGGPISNPEVRSVIIT